jgi:hypothetical protein
MLLLYSGVWKYLTLTRTIGAQSSFGKNSDKSFLKSPFLAPNHRFKPKKAGLFLA